MSPVATPIPYERTSRPLASVTSVNRSVREPSACTSRSFRYSRSVSGKGICRRQHGVGQRLARAEHPSLREVDVEVAVVVDVEQRDAGPDHLLEIVLARHAVEVHEVEPHGLGALGEPLRGGLGRQVRVRAQQQDGRGGDPAQPARVRLNAQRSCVPHLVSVFVEGTRCVLEHLLAGREKALWISPASGRG